MTPHTKIVGLLMITKVVKNERNIPPSRIKLSSLPLALINGVFQCTKNMQAATIVIMAPAQATAIVPRIVRKTKNIDVTSLKHSIYYRKIYYS